METCGAEVLERAIAAGGASYGIRKFGETPEFVTELDGGVVVGVTEPATPGIVVSVLLPELCAPACTARKSPPLAATIVTPNTDRVSQGFTVTPFDFSALLGQYR
jgi:hypothetical protein